jgi:hypothetical protein
LLRAYIAEHIQLLLVVSTHVFFLSACVVETREFSGTAWRGLHFNRWREGCSRQKTGSLKV